MNSDTMKGKWKQWSGKAKQQWGKLTDDDVKQIDGKKDVAVGKLQERYGYTKERAEQEWNQFCDTCGTSGDARGNEA